MGSSSSGGDESKPSILPESSAPTQPLLSSKPFLPDPDDSHPSDDPDENNFPHISYNQGPRHCHDLPFLFLFLLFSLSTFAFGIFSIFHHNPYSSKVSSFSYNSNSSSCVLSSNDYLIWTQFDLDSKTPSFSSPSLASVKNLSWIQLDFNPKTPSSSSLSSLLHIVRNLIWAQLDLDPKAASFSSLSSSSSSHFMKNLIWTLVVTLLISGPFVLGLLWFLRHYTKYIVYASLPFFIILPIFFNVFWFVACTVSSGCHSSFGLLYRILLLIFIFLIIGIVAWIILSNWHRIELTVQIISVSADALARNMGLFGVLPSMSIGLVVYFVPIIVFLVFARLNGKIVVKVSDGSEYSCVWKQDSWVPAYYALAIVTMIWAIAAMVEAQVYVIAGTIAQWYFSKEEGSTPRRSIRTSLRNAFGTSFGTICFSGLLIGAVRVVRAVVDSAKREDAASGIVNLILRCCVNVFLLAIDFLNKFTVIFVAITGDSYCSSAKMTYELLRRNLLSAVFVETVSTRILVGIIFVLSAIYAIVVYAILKAVSALGVEAYFVAIITWLLLIIILGYFVHVLDNVIDTVYVCYAIDRDKGEVCKQEVHEVYVLLPISRINRHSHVRRTPRIV